MKNNMKNCSACIATFLQIGYRNCGKWCALRMQPVRLGTRLSILPVIVLASLVLGACASQSTTSQQGQGEQAKSATRTVNSALPSTILNDTVLIESVKSSLP